MLLIHLPSKKRYIHMKWLQDYLQHFKMAESEASKNTEKKKERQPISVPFIWEERPGTPKKDWKPSPRPIKPVAPPVKLVVSVPFGWEEKPGKPLTGFSQPTNGTTFAQPTDNSVSFPSLPWYTNDDDDKWRGDHSIDEQDQDPDSELETCSSETNDSFSSAPSLLANRLISTEVLNYAVPLQQTSLAQTNITIVAQQSPGSPDSDTDSSASTYATGSTSLAGASFLEWLFPLLQPHSSPIDKVSFLEKDPSNIAAGRNGDFMHESTGSLARRPLLTLGELIMMSRRRSCQRKALKVHKKNHSMDFMETNALGCCMFAAGNGISELHRKWKRQLQLKLM